MVVFGVGSAFLGTSSQAIVGDVIGGRGGTPIAAFQMAADLGAFLGPLAGGYLADVGDFSWAFGMSAGLVVVGVVLAAAMPETLAGARSGRQPPDAVGKPPP
jgi:MFS family permease